MNRILIKSIILIALFLSLAKVTYACVSLEIEIEYGFYNVKTYEAREINVYVTSGSVEDWNITGSPGFSFWGSGDSTHYTAYVSAGVVDEYELQIEAYSSQYGYASDTCTIRAADIYIDCDSFIAYAAGMDIGYELIPPVSVPVGCLYVRDTSEDPTDSHYFYTHAMSLISSYTGTYHWNGKDSAGSYLPKGDYIVGFTSFQIRAESPLRIVEVDSLSDVDYDTGRKYVPLSNEDFYMYADDFYHPIYDHELWLYADSDPLDSLGHPCFPSGSPVWSCTMTPTDPPISSRNGYSSILVNNYLGSQTGNFTITAKASVNDPVGASIDLTSFTASVEPENEYIGYEMGTDITYNISPGTVWSYYSAEICIINESCDYVYKCEVPGFTGELEWDGMGNWDYEQGQYTEPFYLDPDIYWIGIEIVPFYGSEKYLYYTSVYNPNLMVVEVEITSPEGSLDANPNPSSSWKSSPCYHFDFQGVSNSSLGFYNLYIKGSVAPTSLSYKWSLSGTGTLLNDTTDNPTINNPTTGEYILTLKAMDGTVDTGIHVTRKIKIYDDHLARDYATFGTNASCNTNWHVTTFNVNPQPIMSLWNCHGSTNHIFNGSGNGYSLVLSNDILSWSTNTFNAPINWTNVNAVLNRGDVVAYYTGSTLQHSATCINSTTTWGGNNEPVNGPETYKWYLAIPQTWWNNAGINNPPFLDCTKIIVYNRP